MSQIKYTQDHINRVIDLLKQRMSDVEISRITGYSRTFVGNTTTEYWNKRKPIIDEPTTQIGKRKKFNKAFNLPMSENPTLIDNHRYLLQHALMKEELTEYFEACLDRNLVGVADALTDMQEILYGMFAEHGMLDLHNPLYDEVHRSNMSKLGSNGKPIYREDGKVMKGPNYHKPNIAKVLGV